MMIQQAPVNPVDIALIINPRLDKATTKLDSTIAVRIEVNNGGLLLPKIVGNKAIMNNHCPMDITQSCHITSSFLCDMLSKHHTGTELLCSLTHTNELI